MFLPINTFTIFIISFVSRGVQLMSEKVDCEREILAACFLHVPVSLGSVVSSGFIFQRTEAVKVKKVIL